MIDRWIVFGGWALRPQILAPLFGPDTVLIDANDLMRELVRDNLLVTDWQDVLADRILPHVPEQPWGIAGWSTGSMLAYALAHRTKPACGVFISATPSFCRRPGFPYGWKPAVLKAMREELASDPEKILTEVYMQCGIVGNDFGHSFSSNTLKENLIAGLNFLEQTALFPIKLLPFPTLFLHGNADTIIPSGAGKYFCNGAGGTFVEYEGQHAFFVNQYEGISELINSQFKIGFPLPRE